MTKHANSAGNERSLPWLSWAVLLALMGTALILRWRYVQGISLSVDEFNTIWAARNVLVRGLPSFPSGNIYPHGFVFTYLQVPFVLGEMDEAWVRVPGLIIGLLGIPVVYWFGRRLFGEHVGLMAAAAMTVDPDVIVWGSRARMYGLLQLLALLVIYLFYRSLVTDQPRYRYLAMGFLVLAVFTHAEAALLLPALALVMLVAWPWRRLLCWNVLLPFAIAAMGVGLFFLISKFGQPGHLETLQESRPYLDLSTTALSGPMILAPVFTRLHRLPFTLLAIAGLGILLFGRPRWGLLRLARTDSAAALPYLYTVLLGTLLPLLLLAGATWQNERYLFMLLPLLFVIGGEVLCRLLALGPQPRWMVFWQPAALALLVALFVGLTGTRLAYSQEPGYDLAFRYVRERWQPETGDRIITLSPAACVLYLGQCDRFAIQRGYEEFVVERVGDGVTADLWTATPVLTETGELVDLLQDSASEAAETASSVWFVSDGWRFQTRYDADFIQTVIDHMDLEYNERGVMIWRGTGYTPAPEPAVQRKHRAEFNKALALNGFGLSSAQPGPGEELTVTLYWQALAHAGVSYTAFLHLLDTDGRGLVGRDEPVLGDLYQPALWPGDTEIVDRHHLALPSDLPPGRYRLDLGLYPTGQVDRLLPVKGSDRLPLAMLTVGPVDLPPAPSIPAEVDFGNQLLFLGHDLDCDLQPNTCSVQLQWQAVSSAIERDYTVFVHLVGPDGTIVAQSDAPPGEPFFPTSTWLPGAQSAEQHLLTWPFDTPAGDYTLFIGIYHQPTATRLPATASDGTPLGDVLPLVTLSIAPESP